MEQRRLPARIAANARWSRSMARADQAAAARSAIFARLERLVDPAHLLGLRNEPRSSGQQAASSAPS